LGEEMEFKLEIANILNDNILSVVFIILDVGRNSKR